MAKTELARNLAGHFVEKGIERYSGKNLSNEDMFYRICQDNRVDPQLVIDPSYGKMYGKALESIRVHLLRENSYAQLIAMKRQEKNRNYKPAVIIDITDPEPDELVQPEMF